MTGPPSHLLSHSALTEMATLFLLLCVRVSTSSRLRAFLQILTSGTTAQEAAGGPLSRGASEGKLVREESSGAGVSFLRLRSTVVGYHSDLLGSLILALENRLLKRSSSRGRRSGGHAGRFGGGCWCLGSIRAGGLSRRALDVGWLAGEGSSGVVLDSSSLLHKAIEALLWIVPPEALVRIVGGGGPQQQGHNRHAVSRRILQDFNVNLREKYFREQKHGSVSQPAQARQSALDQCGAH